MKASLMEIAQKLLEHAKKTENMIYRNELVLKMVQMCSQNNYANIVNFEWYLNILLDLAKPPGKSTFGDVLSFQILDVTVRVKSIRTGFQIIIHHGTIKLSNRVPIKIGI